jgi:dUTPase
MRLQIAINLKLSEGDHVDANYKGKGKYYPGKVKRDRGDGTFDIDYDDGEFELRVPRNMIRLKDNDKVPSKKVSYEVGDRIGQLIILPYPKINLIEVDELTNTQRGAGAFGSSGR